MFRLLLLAVINQRQALDVNQLSPSGAITTTSTTSFFPTGDGFVARNAKRHGWLRPDRAS
jgi:hypothetical protein